MKCERCGCVILIGEACIRGDGSYHHKDPQTCIKALAIARDWSRNEARRLAAMVCAMSPVVRAARIARVRLWQGVRASRAVADRYDAVDAAGRLALRKAEEAARDAWAEAQRDLRDATAAYARGEGR